MCAAYWVARCNELVQKDLGSPSCNRNSDDDVTCYDQHLLYMCSLAAQCCWLSQYVLLLQHSFSEAGRCLFQHIFMFSCKRGTINHTEECCKLV